MYLHPARLLCVICLVAFGQLVAAKQPNIILIVTDDQGYGDIGYNGNPVIQTPNLDKLAASGVTLNNFYAAPVCTPSRASTLTGKDSIKTGVFDTLNGGSIMDDEEVTLAEILKQQGYRTGIFGKWHLGDNYPFRPSDQGFEQSLVHLSGGIGQPLDPDNFFKGKTSYFSPVLQKNNQTHQSEGYCTDVFTSGAIEFINENSEQPFFAYIAYNAPHKPLQVPDDYLAKYADLEQQIAEHDSASFKASDFDKKQLNNTRRIYAMMTNIDDNIGRLVQSLEQAGELDNTIIVFMSDNGPIPGRYQGDLRGAKSTVYEAGIKVPALLYNLGESGSQLNQTLSHIDLVPTLLDRLDIEYRADDFDGKSFNALLDGEDSSAFDDRTLIYHWHRGYPEAYQNIAVRQGDYKLIGHGEFDMPTGQFELFDISKDPYEQHNLVATQPHKAQALKQVFDDWLKQNRSRENLPELRYQIGAEQQPSVRLNRGDSIGPKGMWIEDSLVGWWNIDVVKSGEYDFIVRFREDLPTDGRIVAKLAPYQRTKRVRKGEGKEFELKRIYLAEDHYSLIVGFHANNGEFIYPLSVILQPSTQTK